MTSTDDIIEADKLQGSLGKKVHAFLNLEVTHISWAQSLKSWEDIRRETVDGKRRDEFEESLSGVQRISWNLLNDWWDSSYQTPSLSQAAQHAIQVAATQDLLMVDGITSEISKAASLQESSYHRHLFTLFHREFNSLHFAHLPSVIASEIANLEHTSLNQARRLAHEHASPQRLAYSYVMHHVDDANAHVELHARNQSIFEPAPWLERQSKDVGLPHFLWDVRHMETIIVKDLDHIPEYTCVSHTWGRWQIEPPLDIPGVPWKVPQTSRFHIEELPRLLLSCQWTTEFVWFDLFCIPQDRSPLALKEISRQASIFQNSSACLAWLNDVESWQGAESAITWLSLHYLHQNSSRETYDVAHRLEEASIGACAESGFLKIEESWDNETDKDLEHAVRLARLWPAWFSSLWTLQETCLCPHMSFVNRKWVRLTDGNGRGVSVSDLVVLVRQWTHFIAVVEGENLTPTGAEELITLIQTTRLLNFLDFPRTDIFILGNLRQCTEYRAEAIMSVLGVKDWFEDSVKKGKAPPSGDDMVLGRYPLAFVREAAQKMGPSFYAVMGPSTFPAFDWTAEKAFGSMLPFVPGSVTGNIYIQQNGRAHDTVRSWDINADGSVSIRRVGIVASRLDETPRDIAVVSTMTRLGESEPVQRVALQDCLNSWPEAEYGFAVCLIGNSNWHFGLILHGVSSQTSNHLCLIKSGVYATQDLGDDIQSTEVDWRVL